ncbi:MAG: hypothetical protein ACQUHE_01800 [Bacteroidia bacterium]
MNNQLTSNAEALALFFTEDIYLVSSSIQEEGEVNLGVQKQKADFKFLGKNQKNILILVNDSENEVSTLPGRELLRKLVKAIDLTANDFALVNYSAYSSNTYRDFREFFNCKLTLAFGVEPAALELPHQTYHQLAVYEGDTVLFAKNLHDLDSDLNSKKMLWASLQQLKA